MNKWITKILLAVTFFGVASCTSSKKDLKVVATAVPHAQILEQIRPELKAQGIHLTIIETEDYSMPNRALVQKEADANFFQHLPFLQDQIQQFHYPIVSFAKVEIEPMGIYSKKIHKLTNLKDQSMIAIPNDPTNEARALLLLQEQGLIQLKPGHTLQATILDIASNPKNLKIIEIDAAMLPRTLEDVDAAVINTNYALAANLSPLKDALAIESSSSPYVNVLVIRSGEENREDLQALKKALTSENMRAFITTTYHGAIVPAF